ncbi:transposase [Streptomyces fractus]|uniref:phage baseplate protein n=1 Tax=Streptomyces fractus TaxID=641806 RepID=UPI003CF729EE
MFTHHFYWDPAGTLCWRDGHALPPASLRFDSPYDTDAHYYVKNGLEWSGYRAHLTECCDDDRPEIVVHATAAIAPVQDGTLLAEIHADLAAVRLLPAEHLVDAAYPTPARIAHARKAHGVTLTDPIPTASGRTAPPDPAFGKAAFSADWDTRRLTCPAGHKSLPWKPLTLNQRPYLQASFPTATCRSCPQRPRCTRTVDRPRSVTLQPTRELHEIQLANWTDQHSREWKDRYATRAGVEALHSQAVRALGLRRSRYRGLPKAGSFGENERVLPAASRPYVERPRYGPELLPQLPAATMGLSGKDRHSRMVGKCQVHPSNGRFAMVPTGPFAGGTMTSSQQDALHLYQADASSWADVSADAEVLFRNVTTPDDGAFESFAVDSVNRNVYIAQIIGDNVQLDDETAPIPYDERKWAGDLVIIRRTMDGTYIDRMYVRGVGHALAIAVDSLPDGTVNLWTGTDASDYVEGKLAYSTKIGYFPYEPSDTTALDSNQITSFMPTGEPVVWAAAAIDPTTRHLLYTYTDSDQLTWNHTLYDLDDAYQGVFEEIATISMERGKDIPMQGVTAVGNYLYVWTGKMLPRESTDLESYGPRVSTVMLRYDFTTGRLAESVLVDDLLDGQDTMREPEGVTVWLADTDSLSSWVLGAGFNSIPPGEDWGPTIITWPGNTTPANSSPRRQFFPAITSRVDAAAEPDTLLLNKPLAEATTGMQAMAFDDVNGHIYTMQITEGGITLSGETAPLSYAERKAAGDMTISRLDTSGTLQDCMHVRGIGYGDQFGADARPDDTVKLWTGVDAYTNGTTGYSTRVGYFDYQPGGVLDNADIDTHSGARFRPAVGYDRWVACNIDPVSRRLIYARTPGGTSVREYTVYDLDDAYQGVFRPLASVTAESDSADAGPSQGFVSYGNYLYVWYGESLTASPEGYSDIRVYDLITDKADKRVSSTSVTALMGEVAYREPAGVAIRTPNPNDLGSVSLVAGFTCGSSDLYTMSLIEWQLGQQTAPAPAGEWANLTLGEGVTGQGFVCLNGNKVETFGRLSKDGGFTSGDIIAALPEEYRPATTQDGIYAASTEGAETLGLVRCDVYTDGTIKVISQPGQIDVAGTSTLTGTGGPYAWISLSGSFYKTSPMVTAL